LAGIEAQPDVPSIAGDFGAGKRRTAAVRPRGFGASRGRRAGESAHVHRQKGGASQSKPCPCGARSLARMHERGNRSASAMRCAGPTTRHCARRWRRCGPAPTRCCASTSTGRWHSRRPPDESARAPEERIARCAARRYTGGRASVRADRCRQPHVDRALHRCAVDRGRPGAADASVNFRRRAVGAIQRWTSPGATPRYPVEIHRPLIDRRQTAQAHLIIP